VSAACWLVASRGAARQYGALAWALILGGALGIVARIVHGHVVDFISGALAARLFLRLQYRLAHYVGARG